MLLGNPLSGLASGPHWLPGGWATLGQILPPGASGSLLRANAFFDGTGAGAPALVLGCWAVLGLALMVIADRRGPRTAAAEPGTRAQLVRPARAERPVGTGAGRQDDGGAPQDLR